jgi:histidinol-phosphate aminotransferase
MPIAPATLVPHGTLDYSELRDLGLRPEELTHFSSNINPFGPPPATIAALRAAVTPEIVARYPDRLSLDVRDLLATYHDLSPDCILVGNGSADLIWLIGLFYLQQRRVAILGPTFGEYHNIAQIMQSKIIELCHSGWIATTNGYEPGETTIQQVVTDLHKANPDVVFVCNPNNPTGHCLTADELDALYKGAPQALWIIDEAYAEFMQPAATSAAWTSRGNWLVLRSMTKDFALGGLRLGYVLGAPQRISALQNVQSPWNVNILAQLAASISLREGQPWRNQTLAQLRAETAVLQAHLRDAGYHPHPTTVNFFLVPVHAATELRRALLARRLVVRDCTSFGLPNFIRIATQIPEANALPVQALRELAPTFLPPTV